MIDSINTQRILALIKKTVWQVGYASRFYLNEDFFDDLNSMLINIKEQHHLEILYADGDVDGFSTIIKGIIHFKETVNSNMIVFNFEITRDEKKSNEELEKISKELTSGKVIKNLIRLKNKRKLS